jgi:hypothetical protein
MTMGDIRGGLALALAACTLVTVASCASDRGTGVPRAEGADAAVSEAASALVESTEARARIDSLRARFRLNAPARCSAKAP